MFIIDLSNKKGKKNDKNVFQVQSHFMKPGFSKCLAAWGPIKHTHTSHKEEEEEGRWRGIVGNGLFQTENSPCPA